MRRGGVPALGEVPGDMPVPAAGQGDRRVPAEVQGGRPVPAELQDAAVPAPCRVVLALPPDAAACVVRSFQVVRPDDWVLPVHVMALHWGTAQDGVRSALSAARDFVQVADEPPDLDAERQPMHHALRQCRRP